MITVHTFDIPQTARVLTVDGELLPGSAANDEAAKISSAVDKLTVAKGPIVFDLTKLKYTSGNYLAGVFIKLRQQNIDFNIVATGNTKEALIGLIDASNIDRIYKINIFDNIDDAALQFAGRPQPRKKKL